MPSVGQAACPVDADFDPLSPTFLADPFAVLSSLARETPVFYAPSIDYYVVTRYADIEAVFLDHETYSAAPAQRPLVQLVPEAAQILLAGGHQPQPSMVSLDPPAHTRLRSPTARAFTPRRVEQMEPRIRATVDQLLDTIDPSVPFDLVSTLSFPLPATIIFSFVGIPERDWPQLKEWCGHRATLAWGRPTPEEQVHHAENMAAYRSYLRGFVATKAHARDDTFASALLAIHDEDPEALTHEEIASILYSLTFAGHETTNYLIGNVVRRLARGSRALGCSRRRPGVDPRCRSRDTPLRSIRPGLAACDDAARHPRRRRPASRARSSSSGSRHPAATRPSSRSQRRSISGARTPRRRSPSARGIHYCLGAALGKLEAEIALEALTRRFPRLRLVEGQELSFHPNISFRGPQALWVLCQSEAAKTGQVSPSQGRTQER